MSYNKFANLVRFKGTTDAYEAQQSNGKLIFAECTDEGVVTYHIYANDTDFAIATKEEFDALAERVAKNESDIATILANYVNKAAGETGDGALVTAVITDSSDGKTVTVASTEKLQEAVELAKSAIQDIKTHWDPETQTVANYVGVYAVEKVSEEGLNTVQLHATEKIQAVVTADASNKGIAEASDVKDYVDNSIEALDSSVSGNSNHDLVSVEVVEENGKLTSITISDTSLKSALDTKLKKDDIHAGNAYVTVTQDETDTSVSVAVNVIDNFDTSPVEENTVADASAIKAYVDKKAAASTTVVDASWGIHVDGSVDPSTESTTYTVNAVADTKKAIKVDASGIGVVVKSDDKVLSIDETNGLQTTMTFEYSSDNKKIYLYGKDKTEINKIGEVDATEFIKDGMLFDTQVKEAESTSETITFTRGSESTSNTFTGLTPGHQYMFFAFQTSERGTEETPTYSFDQVDIHSMIEVYIAGEGLELSEDDNRTFNVLYDEKAIKLNDNNELTLDTSATADIILATDENGLSATIDTDTWQVKSVNETATNGINLSNTNGVVDVTVAPGSVAENDNSVVLGGAVYTADENVKTVLIGQSSDTSAANTIYGAKAYADAKDASLEASLKEYVDDQDAAFDASMKSYVDGSIALLDATVEKIGTYIDASVFEEDGKLTSITIDESKLDSALKAAKTTLTAVTDNTYYEVTKTTDATDNHDNYEITLDVQSGEVPGSDDKIASVSYVDEKVGTAIQSVTSADASLVDASDDYIQVDASTDASMNVTLNSKLKFATTTSHLSDTATGIATDKYVQECLAWEIIGGEE